MPDKTELIKNIPFSEPMKLTGLVDYEEGRVVSRTLSAKPHINITLFAFDKMKRSVPIRLREMQWCKSWMARH